MDLVGPLPTSRRGNQYLLVCTDYFTRWPEAYPLPNMQADTVARVFLHNWICRIGVPHQIHTDQGTQFESQLFQELCKVLEVSKSCTTAYHPQGDGLVERLNRTIVSAVRVYAAHLPSMWDEYVPGVLLAYRSAVHSSTKCTPAMLMFGREMQLPADLVYGPPPCSLYIPIFLCFTLSFSFALCIRYCSRP